MRACKEQAATSHQSLHSRGMAVEVCECLLRRIERVGDRVEARTFFFLVPFPSSPLFSPSTRISTLSRNHVASSSRAHLLVPPDAPSPEPAVLGLEMDSWPIALFDSHRGLRRPRRLPRRHFRWTVPHERLKAVPYVFKTSRRVARMQLGKQRKRVGGSSESRRDSSSRIATKVSSGHKARCIDR